MSYIFVHEKILSSMQYNILCENVYKNDNILYEYYVFGVGYMNIMLSWHVINIISSRQDIWILYFGVRYIKIIPLRQDIWIWCFQSGVYKY